jgi:hypothetical protein
VERFIAAGKGELVYLVFVASAGNKFSLSMAQASGSAVSRVMALLERWCESCLWYGGVAMVVCFGEVHRAGDFLVRVKIDDT